MTYTYTATVKPFYSAKGDVNAPSPAEAKDIVRRLVSLEAGVPRDKVRVDIKETV